METSSHIISQAPIRLVNISLSPENFCRMPSPHLPYIKRRNQSQIKSSKICKPPTDTYSIGYIGDDSGKLRISFKRSSIPKISYSEINRSGRKISPSIKVHNTSEYSIHKYFKPKALAPASLKMFCLGESRNNRLSSVSNSRNTNILFP